MFVRLKQLINSSPNQKIEPDFPCLADEIAEPRPGMIIKVAAFTVSQKSINTQTYNMLWVFPDRKRYVLTSQQLSQSLMVILSQDIKLLQNAIGNT